MELIYQNIIANKNRKMKTICFLVLLFVLVTATGCGSKTLENADKGKNVSGKKGVMEEAVKGAKDAEGTDTAKDPAKETTDGDAPITMAQLINESYESAESNSTDTSSDSDAEPLPDTVLWFNATYAPLTYSNGGDWKRVGGSYPEENSEAIVKLLLERDWNIEDRDSALETVERLKNEGHRKKCQECMDELEERGFLDLDEDAFTEEIMESEIEENLFRYVIAYYMYQEGMDADYIAAWDLCRVNQLYADFYVCGYMTYEEAMDASLENSLTLQKLYPSWEKMMDSYMLGYQFWKNDSAMTEDSPTMERYRYYKMLQQTEDGPYSLDWDMELEKSW